MYKHLKQIDKINIYKLQLWGGLRILLSFFTKLDGFFHACVNYNLGLLNAKKTQMLP